MTARNNSIWMRLGVSVFGSAEEIDNVLNEEHLQLIKLLREGRFEINGDTYIPDTSVDEYNQTNGTHYTEQNIEFNLNLQSCELNSIDLAKEKSAEFLSKGETIIRICPNTKRPLLVSYGGNERCLCLYDDSVKEDGQAIDDWLSANSNKTMAERTEITDEDDTLESILEDSDKCESFAEVILGEISSDEEQPRHIGSNIIKAYLNGDCDELLIALCGWSMDSLLKKYQKSRKKFYTCPECQEEALRYAMIDTDGTNLEEGYCCEECEAEFLGLHNHEVIEFNPEIIADDE